MRCSPGHDGFVTAAGYVGPHVRVDHDISLLVPEIWSRMTAQERDPQVPDRERLPRKMPGLRAQRPAKCWRAGSVIASPGNSCSHYFGRVFNHPHVVFTEEMLRPELQDMEIFVDGMDNIVGTHKRVAAALFQ